MRALLSRLWVAVLMLCATPGMCAQNARPQWGGAPARTVNVVMLSDLHFDPFSDPSMLPALREAPVSEWAEILKRPESASRAAAFRNLQESCQVRGADSSWALVRSSLQQAKLREPRPLFVTVSGDLLAHGFPCKFQALTPRATPEDLSAFSAKTIAFLVLQLRSSFPSVPVYFALGNNDSGCGDYRATPDSAFLRSVGASSGADLPDDANRASLLRTFPHLGDYSVMLPAPMMKTRLIVLQDIFESSHFLECDGRSDAHAANEQIAWLHAQLSEARANGEQVWVMAHIPPGIDIYGSFHRYLFAPEEACHVTHPLMFLSNNALGNTIAEFSDVVRLAIFAHTHMDEIKLIADAQGGAVPAKLVPSISPINGNDPGFVVAQVSAQTATLKDYTVYVAANAQGADWTKEYRYSAIYGLPDFSAASVRQLTSNLIGDKTGEDATSRDYEHFFMAGGGTFATLGLQRLWPAYSCSLQTLGADAFHRCMCPPETTVPKPAP